MKKYTLLDAFRGIAIIWIVLLHILEQYDYGDIINGFVRHGYLGVQIFFVISGYTIAGALERAVASGQSWHDFFLKRSKRIYITYWFSIIFAALIIPAVMAMVSALKNHHLVFEPYHYSLMEWVGIITLTKIFTATDIHLNHAFLPLNGVVWFIAILVQIYIAASLSLLFGKKHKQALLLLFLFCLLTYIPQIGSLFPFGLFFPYFPDFYVGMAVYYAIQKGICPKKDRSYILYLSAFLVISIILIKYSLNQFIFSVITGAMFYLLYPMETELSRFKTYGILIFIGSFSYSLYLLQIPLWQLTAMFVRNLVPLPEKISTPLILVPCVMFISYIWYLFFEKPIKH